MIGDSANNPDAARNAGIPVVLVTFGYTATPVQELGADALIDHFDQLPPALNQLA
jgi:phosphoglycolate phosphatase